jgi:hypothetical protein
VAAVATLIYKRHTELPRRPWLVWFFDATKQAFAGVRLALTVRTYFLAFVWVHVTRRNLLISDEAGRRRRGSPMNDLKTSKPHTRETRARRIRGESKAKAAPPTPRYSPTHPPTTPPTRLPPRLRLPATHGQLGAGRGLRGGGRCVRVRMVRSPLCAPKTIGSENKSTLTARPTVYRSSSTKLLKKKAGRGLRCGGWCVRVRSALPCSKHNSENKSPLTYPAHSYACLACL